MKKETWTNRWEGLIALLVLAVLFYYTLVYIYGIPYNGFLIQNSGEISKVFVNTAAPNNLVKGDILIKLWKTDWFSLIVTDAPNPLYTHKTGDHLAFTVLRDKTLVEVDWVYLQPQREEILYRIYRSNWLLIPYMFWLAGALTLVLIRPRDLRRTLLTAF